MSCRREVAWVPAPVLLTALVSKASRPMRRLIRVVLPTPEVSNRGQPSICGHHNRWLSLLYSSLLCSLGAAFLWSIETRIKRDRAIRAINELRDIAHVIDMKQLTKDPDTVSIHAQPTTHSPERRLDAYALGGTRGQPPISGQHNGWLSLLCVSLLCVKHLPIRLCGTNPSPQRRGCDGGSSFSLKPGSVPKAPSDTAQRLRLQHPERQTSKYLCG